MKKIGIAFLSSLAVLLTACGGAGGGGPTYTGVTTAADISNTNANQLVSGAYQNGNYGSKSAVAVVSGSDSTNRIDRPRALAISDVLTSSLKKIDFAKASSTTATGATQSGSVTVSGSCGGSLTANISVDDVTGHFSGTVSYSNYCESGSTINGSTNFSGTFNLSGGYIAQYTATLNSLTVQACGESGTTSGTVSMAFNGSTTVTLNIELLIADNSTGKVYWINNLQYTIVAGAGYTDVSVSGKFYDPDYGYVTLSTSTPLRIYDGYYWPTSGVLNLTGATGIAGGSTTATFTATPTGYTITADTDGDGVDDYADSGAWSALGAC